MTLQYFDERHDVVTTNHRYEVLRTTAGSPELTRHNIDDCQTFEDSQGEADEVQDKVVLGVGHEGEGGSCVKISSCCNLL